MLERLQRKGLKLDSKKCEFRKRELTILDLIISKEGVKIDLERIKSISELPVLKNKKKLQSLLDLYNYCSRFIQDSHKIVHPLYKILKLKGEEKTRFGRMQDMMNILMNALNLKNAVCKAILVTLPNTKDKFILTTDASIEECGAMNSNNW